MLFKVNLSFFCNKYKQKHKKLLFLTPTSVKMDETYPILETVHLKHPKAFLLRVSGNSINKVVKDGMFALIDPEESLKDSDIVAAYINGHEATLKRFHPLANGIMLEPDSTDPTYTSELIDFNDEGQAPYRVVGKMVWYVVPFGYAF